MATAHAAMNSTFGRPILELLTLRLTHAIRPASMNVPVMSAVLRVYATSLAVDGIQTATTTPTTTDVAVLSRSTAPESSQW